MDADGLSPSFGAKAFVGLGLYGNAFYRNAQAFGQRLANRGDMRIQFGFLGNHGRIDIGQATTGLLYHNIRFCKELQAISAFVGGVGVWKMLTDASQGCGPKQGIGNRMGEDVRV